LKIEQIFLNRHVENPGLKFLSYKFEPDLVFVFGVKEIIDELSIHSLLRETYPSALLIGCSSAGEILNTDVYDDSVIVTLLKFEDTVVKGEMIRINEKDDSFSAGKYISDKLKNENLKHLFVLSEGLNINGTELVKGLQSSLQKKVSLSGGLAADGNRFEQTYVMFNDSFDINIIAAVGFYSNKLKVGCGSFGGWEPFGPERLVTRSVGNVVYEFDSRPALELYKNYLGDHAKGLPATGLLFPLSIKDKDKGTSIVRSIVAVNESTNSLVFAGEVAEHSIARLMKTNSGKLIDGAGTAVNNCFVKKPEASFEFALVVSCFGRKLVLKQQIEEEIETLKKSLGSSTLISGFYSYGEIAPVKFCDNSELQNQTLSLTLLSEN
jgi:hypothetical protein